MSTYRIVCTEQQPASQPPSHAHIVAVGVGSDASSANERFTLAQVIQKLDVGDKFYTQGVTSGKTAMVEKYWCGHCRQYHIRSTADAVLDNNLDKLRYCSWKR
jgi:uncharacterized protein DUF3892